MLTSNDTSQRRFWQRLGQYLNLGIWCMGLLTILATLYATSFFVVRNKIVFPYEYEQMFETHWIRPFYNPFYYPLRWFVANGKSFNPENIKWRYGWLREPMYEREEMDMRSMHLETYSDTGNDGDTISISFTGSPEVLEKLDNIPTGSFVHAQFGSALAKDGDRFINRLISIESVELVEDPRIPFGDYSDSDEKKIYAEFKALPKKCANEFLDNYRDKLLGHCQQAGYGQDVGGGCYHIVGYAIHTAVLEAAIKQCGIEDGY